MERALIGSVFDPISTLREKVGPQRRGNDTIAVNNAEKAVYGVSAMLKAKVQDNS